MPDPSLIRFSVIRHPLPLPRSRLAAPSPASSKPSTSSPLLVVDVRSMRAILPRGDPESVTRGVPLNSPVMLATSVNTNPDGAVFETTTPLAVAPRFVTTTVRVPPQVVNDSTLPLPTVTCGIEMEVCRVALFRHRESGSHP